MLQNSKMMQEANVLGPALWYKDLRHLMTEHWSEPAALGIQPHSNVPEKTAEDG